MHYVPLIFIAPDVLKMFKYMAAIQYLVGKKVRSFYGTNIINLLYSMGVEKHFMPADFLIM